MPNNQPLFDILLEPEAFNAFISSETSNHSQWVLLDLSQAQMYASAHIPGAIHVPINLLNVGTKPAPGLLPPKETIQTLINELGITPDTHVICYDDEGGGWAGRFIWMLDILGHSQSSYLNGGIRAWLALGFDTERAPNKGKPCIRDIQIDTKLVIDKQYILSHLNDPDLIVWDARSPEEFRGERVFALKGGHIPGAVNYEWTRAMDIHNQLRLRPLDEIRKELAELGINEDKNIITHCQTHHRSSFTYLVGKILGFKNIRGYPGSWSEWGNAQDTPVAT